MVESLSARHRDPARTELYSDVVVRLNKTYNFGLSRDTIRTAKIYDVAQRFLHDLAHKEDHPRDLAWCIEIMIECRPSLLNEVNWGQAFDFISLHDRGRGLTKTNVVTLFSNQLLEHVIAPRAARQHLEHHRFGPVDEELLEIIRRHPYHAGHPKRAGQTFSKTEQLVVDVDGLSVLTPNRVDKMYAHIKKSFFGVPLEPFHGLLARIFDRYTHFGFFYPEADAIARSWRPEVEEHIQKKFFSRQKTAW